MNLGLLQIGWNEYPALQSVARGLCSGGIGQVAGRRARDGVESKAAGVGESHGDDAVFKAQGRQADGVIFDE